ncbi:Ribonuclease T1 [Candidatus Nitrotoga arctica]|uniref:Ribonuclease T1 n=2 Tax=Candidatus Nitrotoga arctica TaxID=453162 RepID=A0ABN8AKX8_9PROT|nr:Ribonuclease T1 [Candidatus Nitrotoga arctica]
MRMASARLILHLFFLFAMLLALASVQTYADVFGSYNDREMRVVAVSALPLEGRETLHLIKQGSPFLYARDGVIFSNFEKRLPKRQRGYYREFTVKTPGIRNRGARRIVCGQPVECYYSADHYQTFRRIVE